MINNFKTIRKSNFLDMFDAVVLANPDSEIILDFDFTLTNADTEAVFYELIRSVEWGSVRISLSKKERLLKKIGRFATYSLFESILKRNDESTLNSIRLFFCTHFLESYTLDILNKSNNIIVVSHCPDNLLNFLIGKYCRAHGRVRYQTHIDKTLFSGKDSIIFSDSSDDFKGEWKECFKIC